MYSITEKNKDRIDCFRVLKCALPALLCVLMAVSAASAETGQIVYAGGTCYTDNAQLYICDEKLIWFDYESGSAMPLCLRPDCRHQWSTDFEYGTFKDMLSDQDECLALRTAAAEGPYILLNDRLYLFEQFPDIFNEKHQFNLWSVTLDGHVEKLIEMGNAFSWDVLPECHNALLKNDELFFVVQTGQNPYSSNPADEVGGTSEEAILYHANLNDGVLDEVMRISGMQCSLSPLFMNDDILYYSYSVTAAYTPSVTLNTDNFVYEEANDIYIREYEDNTFSGFLGVHVKTGETIVPEPRIARVNAETARKDLCWGITDSQLWLFMNPQLSGTDRVDKSLFELIDLNNGNILKTCKAPLIDYYEGFSPYYMLDDDRFLCYIFYPAGVFSIYELSSGSEHELPLHNEFSALPGETAYDIFDEAIQTEYIFFSADRGWRNAFLTRAMILNGEYEPITLEIE